MSTKLRYFYIFVFSAVFTMVLASGFTYMMLFNMMLHLDFSVDVLLYGLTIGFIGALVCSLLDFKGFVPFGWIGAIAGLFLTDLSVALTTPYGLFYEEGIGYVIEILFNFIFALFISTTAYYILNRIVKTLTKPSDEGSK